MYHFRIPCGTCYGDIWGVWLCVCVCVCGCMRFLVNVWCLDLCCQLFPTDQLFLICSPAVYSAVTEIILDNSAFGGEYVQLLHWHRNSDCTNLWRLKECHRHCRNQCIQVLRSMLQIKELFKGDMEFLDVKNVYWKAQKPSKKYSKKKGEHSLWNKYRKAEWIYMIWASLWQKCSVSA